MTTPAPPATPAPARGGRGRLVGALAGQGTLALAGLVLQVAAARELGAAGLATFSLVYGAVVLATAVTSGLVGDSLTVLDRHDPGVRAALHRLALGTALGTGLAGGLLAALAGWGSAWAGVWIGVATVSFVLEDLLRRLLQATGRYWRLPAVDLSGAAAALAVLVALRAGGPLDVPTCSSPSPPASSSPARSPWRCSRVASGRPGRGAAPPSAPSWPSGSGGPRGRPSARPR